MQSKHAKRPFRSRVRKMHGNGMPWCREAVVHTSSIVKDDPLCVCACLCQCQCLCVCHVCVHVFWCAGQSWVCVEGSGGGSVVRKLWKASAQRSSHMRVLFSCEGWCRRRSVFRCRCPERDTSLTAGTRQSHRSDKVMVIQGHTGQTRLW